MKFKVGDIVEFNHSPYIYNHYEIVEEIKKLLKYKSGDTLIVEKIYNEAVIVFNKNSKIKLDKTYNEDRFMLAKTKKNVTTYLNG